MAGAFILEVRDTMSLPKADLGSVCARARAIGLTQTPQQNRPLSPLREPLHWKAKRDPKAAVLSTEGRVVGLCWENQNLMDTKDFYGDVPSGAQNI